MRDSRLAVFAYAFPHRKTQDFISVLCEKGYKPDLVIASPREKLSLPKRAIMRNQDSTGLVEPKDLCNRLDVNYSEVRHNDPEVIKLIASHRINLGVIAGARIIKDYIISSFDNRIINFHPGLLPENRGLDSYLWAIKMDMPQGMTVHYINEKVDHGKIIRKFLVPVFIDDSLDGINQRIYDLQVTVLPEIIEYAKSHEKIGTTITGKGGYHKPADEEVDLDAIRKFELYKNKWACKQNENRCLCNGFVHKTRAENIYSCDVCGNKYIERNGFLEFI